jgi:hypothetical protein
MVRYTHFALALATVSFGVLHADEKQKPRGESMSSDPFEEVRVPIFQPKKAPAAGSLTDRVSRSLSASPASSTAIAERNYIDKRIFGKLRKEGIPHARNLTDFIFNY